MRLFQQLKNVGPIDVANMCRFLASEASDMITGEIIPIRAWNPSERFWT